MFVKDGEGRLHVGRIAGVLYLIGIAPRCILSHDAYCDANITFIAGWWLCFCTKQRRIYFREMFDPLGIVGLLLVALGLAGSFYFVAKH